MRTDPDAWRQVWRVALAPLLPTAGLEALRQALLGDLRELIQGDTVEPPPAMPCRDACTPATGACAVALPLWRARGLTTVAEVDEAFLRLWANADARLVRLCRPQLKAAHFLAWFDRGERREVFPQLLAEVCRNLAHRKSGEMLSEEESPVTDTEGGRTDV